MNAQRVRAYMKAHGMTAAGERVLCACSGGADSVALLHLLTQAAEPAPVCAHFNHCLRGAESDADEAFVQNLCAAWKVEFVSARGDVRAYAREKGLGIEAAAREMRYSFLERAARKTGCARIATAHTADDNAETVLLNLIRGAGARGLAGIPPVRGNVIRPLLCVTRREIEDYLAQNGLTHIEDSSNASDDFTRNRLRHHALPLLREINCRAVAHICSTAELLREDEAYFGEQVENFIAEYYVNSMIPASALLSLPRPVAMRVLLRLCHGAGRERLEALYALCASNAPYAVLELPGHRVVLEHDRLCFDAPETIPRAAQRFLHPGKYVDYPELGKRIICSEATAQAIIHSSFKIFYFQSHKVCGKISVGSRAAGDQIRLLGRGCTKSVRRLFSERRLTQAQRAQALVFRDAQGVIAVEGFGVAERCAAEAGSPALRVEITAL